MATGLPGRIDVIAVGKLRSAHWAAAQAEYAKRLKRYGDFRVIEVKDSVGRLPDKAAIEKEGHALLASAGTARRRIALVAAGRRLSSEGLAAFIGGRLETYGHLAIVIGGPVGLAKPVIETCEDALSLSSLTLPHELARVVLLEQRKVS